MKNFTRFRTKFGMTLAALAAAFTLGFAACSTETETEYVEVEKQDTSTYTITFYANADDVMGETASVSAKAGSMVTLSPNGFLREGYVFSAWATSAGGAKAYFDGANILLARDLSLYAVWETLEIPEVPLGSFAVSFDSGGGSTVATPIVVVEGGGMVAQPADPARTGYTFAGWYSGDSAFDFSAPVTDNLYLVAHWNAVTYTITYHLNGGDWASGYIDANGENTAQAYTATTAYTVEDSVFLPDADEVTRAGYGFAGWFEDEAFSGEAVHGLEGATGNKAYYAKWVSGAVIYTVSHLRQNADDDDYTIYRVQQCSGITDEQTKATAESYYGFTAQDFSQQTIAGDESTVVAIKYDRKTFTVTFDAMGGTSVAPESVRYEAKATSPADPTRESSTKATYAFDGWHTSGDGGTTLSERAFDFDTPITENTALYAKWVAKIGTKAPDEAKAVGDIVFSDGSATPYTEGLTLSDELKEEAIAVIFYVGTELNSDDANGNADTTTVRTLGVGLTYGDGEWCKSTASAYKLVIDPVVCTPIGITRNWGFDVEECSAFTGDKNGSDNLQQIRAFLAARRYPDDTTDAQKYRAFTFAENYASQEGSRVSGTAYESGWYLPSIAELFQVWKHRETLNAAIAACGGREFNLSKKRYLSDYISSSQHDGYDSNGRGLFVFQINFLAGTGTICEKHGGVYACAVREF